MSLRIWMPLNKDPNKLPDITSFSKESGVSLTADSDGYYKIQDSSHVSSRWGIYYNLPVKANTSYTLYVYSKSPSGNTANLCVAAYNHSGLISWPAAVDTNTSSTEKYTAYTFTTSNTATVARVYLSVTCTATSVNNYILVKDPRLVEAPENQGLSRVTVMNYGATYSATDGKFGGCYSFDGVNDRLTISGLTLPNTWSYGCWFYSAVSSRGWEGVITLNNTATDSDAQMAFYTYPSGNRIQNTANGQFNSTITYVPGQWNHFMGTFDGSNLKTYINGILVNTKSITNNLLSRSNLTIGASSTNNAGGGTSIGLPFSGKINDVRIYDNCLSAEEIKKISQCLVLHYPLNRNGLGTDNLILNSVYDSNPWAAAMINKSIEHDGKQCMLVWIHTLYNSTSSGTTTIFPGLTFEENTQYTLSWSWKDDYRTDGSHTGMYVRFKYSDGTYTNAIATTSCIEQWEDKILISTAGKTVTAITTTYYSGSAMYLTKFKLEKGVNPNPSYSPSSLEGNNLIEYDCSGYGNNGEKIGTLTYTNDSPKGKGATHIGATSQKIHISNFPTIGFGNSYSIAWWGKASSLSGGAMMWGFADGIRLNGFHGGTLWNTGDASNNPLYIPGTTTQVTAPTGNTWHHFVMVGDGSTCKAYQDGELWGQAKTYKSISGTSIYINGWNSVSDYTFSSLDISDFRIYATALSADDIKSLYQNEAYVDSNGTVYGPVH